MITEEKLRVAREMFKRRGREQGRSGEDHTSTGRSTEKETEQAPLERVGEVVGYSSGE